MSKIQEIVVTTGGQASIDFTAIPQTYRHLVLVSDLRDAGGGGDVLMQCNGDTSANYDLQQMYSSNAQAAGYHANGTTGLKIAQAPGSGAAAGISGAAETTLFNYAGTTFHKKAKSSHVYNTDTGTTEYDLELAAWWRSTAAITSLHISAPTSFVAGSVVSLYGIA